MAKKTKQSEQAPKRMPIEVTAADRAFGGKVNEILPPWAEIPEEFKRQGGQWVAWQQDWFFRGLKRYPVPREGIDLRQAMANLACVQGSFAPKHEHKQAGVAYLASLWFTSPDGEQIKSAA
jgi:hypothetical protein